MVYLRIFKSVTKALIILGIIHFVAPGVIPSIMHGFGVSVGHMAWGK
jgi:hypothetical protein